MEKTLAKSALKTKEDGKHEIPGISKSGTQRPLAKENTKPVDVKLHTQQRAVKRATFNYLVATKLCLMELQKRQEEKLQKMLEEEEVRLLRKEMIPRAQLMPLFDRPFFPHRSSRPLTIPREPAFRLMSNSSKFWTCIYCNHFDFHQCHTIKAIK